MSAFRPGDLVTWADTVSVDRGIAPNLKCGLVISEVINHASVNLGYCVIMLPNGHAVEEWIDYLVCVIRYEECHE